MADVGPRFGWARRVREDCHQIGYQAEMRKILGEMRKMGWDKLVNRITQINTRVSRVSGQVGQVKSKLFHIRALAKTLFLRCPACPTLVPLLAEPVYYQSVPMF